MQYSDYVAMTRTTAVYPEFGTGSTTELTYLALGLVDEAVELEVKLAHASVGFIKVVDDEISKAIYHELGDAFWYWARLRDMLNDDSPLVNEADYKLDISNAHYRTNIMRLIRSAGMVAGRAKKVLREGHSLTEGKPREDIIKHLHKAFCAMQVLANFFGKSEEEIWQMNSDKLLDRKGRGVLTGDGDNR